MKSINEILNSIVQSAQDSNGLAGANASNGPKAPVSGPGSFQNVLSQLASQNSGSSNSGAGNGGSGNSATSSNTTALSTVGNASSSINSIAKTDIQVTETTELNNPTAKELANLEQSVMSLAAGLSQLVQLASNLQNMSPAQAQNLVVSASGGTISPAQAQALLTQIAAIKNAGSGQNALLLTLGQQNNLLAQMLQGMIQNQQVYLTQNPAGQGASNSSIGNGSESTDMFLRVNFSNTQILATTTSNNQSQSLFLDLQTLNVTMAAAMVPTSSVATGSNLTQATTDRLTNLLQELQVTPANAPVSINVQGAAVPVTQSPELVRNFQNLVQVLTQAGAGQAVLSNFLAQQKNDTTGELKQAFNQNLSLENLLSAANPAVEVPPVTGANSMALSENNTVNVQNQVNLAEVQAELLALNQNQPASALVGLPTGANNQNITTQNQSALLAAGVFITPSPENTPASSTGASQPVFQTVAAPVSGQVESLNAIVALFNSSVVQPKGPNVSANTLNGTINGTAQAAQANLVPAVNPAGIVATQPLTPFQTASLSPSAVTPVTAGNTAGTNNPQTQLNQSNSPAVQQTNTNIDTSLKDTFVQSVSVNNTTVALPSTASTLTGSGTPVAAPAVTPVPAAAPSVQTVVSTNGNPITVSNTSGSSTGSSSSTAAVATASVVTAPVTVLPAASTAPNIPATAVAGEVVKASVPAPVLSNNINAANQQAVPNVQAVSAVQTVSPVAAAPVAPNSEISTSLNTASNADKNLSTDANAIQAQISALVSSAPADKTSGNFQTTVANASAANAPNGNIDSAQILNQITQQVAAQTADAKLVSRLSFQLVPENLGKVTIQIALVDQSVSARIIVSNPDVREAIQQHMVDLKTAMNQAGLQIDQLQVQVGGGSSNLLTQYFQYQQEGSAYRFPVSAPPSEQSQTLENTGVLGAMSQRTSLVNVLA